MATPLQIGGMVNLEERSGSFLPELPYTNRGVIRQKEALSALIDWCQITIKEVPLEAVIEDVLRIPLELMTVTGYEKGIAGHEVVAIFDNIKVLKPTGNAQYQGFQILMSGKGCRNYENFLQLNEETWFDFLNRVCQYHINVPRIDLAIDDRKPYLSIPDLIVRTKEGLLSTKLREIDFHDSGELKEEVFQKKSLQKVWEWLEKYVAPSLKLFAEVGKIEKRDYIGNLVANGEMNITQKQLYDDYIKARRLEERG